jgi:hypothetical protein
LLTKVVERYPSYLPALVRLCEINGYATGREAEGAVNCERALAVDPLSEEARRLLVKIYLDLGEIAAAIDVAGAPDQRADVAWMQIRMVRKEWLPAGEIAYEVLEYRTDSPNARGMVLAAIRMHAQISNETARAIAAIEKVANVEWDAAGNPVLAERSPLRDDEIELGAILLRGPQPERGRRLLTAVVERMQRDLRSARHAEYWYLRWHPVALALLGRREDALRMLERAGDRQLLTTQRWWFIDTEPAFDTLRKDPRFGALGRDVAQHVAEQQLELERLRREGLIPDRTAAR